MSLVSDGRVRGVVARVLLVAAGVCCCLSPCAFAAGDINQPECSAGTESSPGFRSYMPDCRAFELVNPPFISGATPLGVGFKKEPPQISADGEHVLSKILGGFAGTEALEQKGTNFGAVYEFSRTSAGWSAEALDPPSSLYPRSEFAFASADFSRSLWAVQAPQAPGEELAVAPPPGNGYEYPNNGELVLREQAGDGKGRFTVVGPVTAPGHEPSSEPPGRGSGFYPEGASADLSHILLLVHAEKRQLWPGDETQEGAESLYEYAGTGDREPVLVGVKNKHSLAEEATREDKEHINEAAELVSTCGTVLGGSGLGGSTANGPFANAVSASGEIVYFTALACGSSPNVNELYARVDGRETVDISEPSEEDCSACVVPSTVAEGRAPAAFQGASEDGSKVFFTSQQELLPGARGNSLYEYDFNAANPHERLSVLAPEVGTVAAISQDGERVYFESTTVLTDTSNGNGETAEQAYEEGASRLLYVYDTQTREPAFVASEIVTAEAEEARTTRDGQYLVFISAKHIGDTNDTSSIGQIFEYDAATGLVARVSRGQRSSTGYECETTHVVEEGFNCDGNTTNGALYNELLYPLGVASDWAPTAATSGLVVAADGTVEFVSTNALTPLAVLGKKNVYEYRAGDVYLVAPGVEAVAPYNRLLGIDESGQDLFFASTEGLVPQDISSGTVWYDAREEGGFPAPTERPACEGEACRGALSGAPAFAVPTSNTLSASGNLAPPAELKPAVKPATKPKAKNCEKGFVKKKGRCVRTPKSKKAEKAGTKRGSKS